MVKEIYRDRCSRSSQSREQSCQDAPEKTYCSSGCAGSWGIGYTWSSAGFISCSPFICLISLAQIINPICFLLFLDGNTTSRYKSTQRGKHDRSSLALCAFQSRDNLDLLQMISFFRRPLGDSGGIQTSNRPGGQERWSDINFILLILMKNSI